MTVTDYVTEIPDHLLGRTDPIDQILATIILSLIVTFLGVLIPPINAVNILLTIPFLWGIGRLVYGLIFGR